MNRKQYLLLLVVLTIVAGLVGGAVSNRVFMARTAAAQERNIFEQALREPVAQVIKAREFRLVDRIGETHAKLFLYDRKPLLAFYDSNGKALTVMGISDGGYIEVFDSKGVLIGSLPSKQEKVSTKPIVAPNHTEIDAIFDVAKEPAEVVGLEAKVVERLLGGFAKYSWRLTLRNNTNRSLTRITAVIEFQDSAGFVVDKDFEYFVKLRPREEKTLTGTHIVIIGAGKVSRYAAKIEM